MTLPSKAAGLGLPRDRHLPASLWTLVSAILTGKPSKAVALLAPPFCLLLRETEVLSREVASAVNAACTTKCAIHYVQGSKFRALYTTASKAPALHDCSPMSNLTLQS